MGEEATADKTNSEDGKQMHVRYLTAEQQIYNQIG